MRKYLMAGVATAALMFGLNQAMAQSSTGGQGATSQGATTSAPSASTGSSGGTKKMSQPTSQGSKTIGQARDQDSAKGMSGSTDRSKSEGSKTIGQSRDQSESKGMSPSSKMGDRDRGDRDKMGQRDNDRTRSKTTTGQSRDEMKDEKGAQAPSSSSSTKMGQQPSTNQQPSTKMGQQPASNRETTGSASSSATQLTTEQRTEVREKVLVNAPRENNVTFAVNVGTVVPRTVHVAEVPETLIRIHPDWRGHRFFVVHDEIIIVDNDFRIIAVLPV